MWKHKVADCTLIGGNWCLSAPTNFHGCACSLKMIVFTFVSRFRHSSIQSVNIVWWQMLIPTDATSMKEHCRSVRSTLKTHPKHTLFYGSNSVWMSNPNLMCRVIIEWKVATACIRLFPRIFPKSSSWWTNSWIIIHFVDLWCSRFGCWQTTDVNPSDDRFTMSDESHRYHLEIICCYP